jgi:hypothetical protein
MRDLREETVSKLLKGKPSPRKRIAAMCCSCIYDPDSLGAGTWRNQVKDCASLDCPIYPERPLPSIGKQPTGENQ